MAMTRRDYSDVALVLGRHMECAETALEEAVIRDIANDLACAFKASNNNFKDDRFFDYIQDVATGERHPYTGLMTKKVAQ